MLTNSRVLGAALAAGAAVTVSLVAWGLVRPADAGLPRPDRPSLFSSTSRPRSQGSAPVSFDSLTTPLTAASESTVTFTVDVQVPGDVDGDGFVGPDDLDLVAAAYRLTADDREFDQDLDLVRDHSIDLLDLYFVARRAGSN